MISLISILIAALVILIVYIAKSEYKNHEQLKNIRHVMSSREREWYQSVKSRLRSLEASETPDEEEINDCKTLLKDIKSGRAFGLDSFTVPY